MRKRGCLIRDKIDSVSHVLVAFLIIDPPPPFHHQLNLLEISSEACVFLSSSSRLTVIIIINFIDWTRYEWCFNLYLFFYAVVTF